MTTLLLERITAHATAHRHRPAIIQDGEIVNYVDLEARASSVASGLIARGFRPGMRIALLAGNEPSIILVWLGILKARGSVVALPQGVAIDALRRMLDDCGAQFVIADGALDLTRDLWPGAPERWPERLMLIDPAGTEVEPVRTLMAAAHRALPQITGADEFNIIYSSGTTGVPKGIVHTHAIRVARIDALLQGGGFDESARVLVTTPLYTNWSAIAVIIALCAGGAVVLHRQFAIEHYQQALRKDRITHTFIVPAQLARLLDHPGFDAAVAGTSSTKYCAGAPLAASRKRETLARWPGPFLEIYGMTEGSATTVLHANAHPDKLDTVGQPLPGTSCYILDSEGCVLPQGEVGEIAGGSSASMPGYHNRPDLTASIRWTAPDGSSCYRSGDLGWLDADGFLHISGRAKDMIVSGGMNIYATDLEATIATHPDVADVAVIGIPSEQWGETPLAVVVLKEGRTVEPEAIRHWTNERVGKFQRLSRVEVCAALPRGSLDKVAKNELRRRYAG